MKAPVSSRRRHAAFTMVELLVVMGIILVLAALTLGGMQYFQKKTKIKKAELQVKLISQALEEYKLDNGEYPQAANSNGAGQSNVLFQKLYWDGVQNNTKVYLSELNPDQKSQGKFVSGSDVNATILDPFGKEYFYRAGASTQRNPDFDLWSAGPDGETTGGSPTAGQANEDDVW